MVRKELLDERVSAVSLSKAVSTVREEANILLS